MSPNTTHLLKLICDYSNCINGVPLCLQNSISQHLATSTCAMRLGRTCAGDLWALHSCCRLCAGSFVTLGSRRLCKNKD